MQVVDVIWTPQVIILSFIVLANAAALIEYVLRGLCLLPKDVGRTAGKIDIRDIQYMRWKNHIYDDDNEPLWEIGDLVKKKKGIAMYGIIINGKPFRNIVLLDILWEDGTSRIFPSKLVEVVS